MHIKHNYAHPKLYNIMDFALQRTLRCAQLFPDASSPAGVSFKSHVRDVAPRLMSVFNFTTSDFGQVSTFDWTIHLEPALNTFLFLKLFVVLNSVEWSCCSCDCGDYLSWAGGGETGSAPVHIIFSCFPGTHGAQIEHTVHRLNTLSTQCND